MKANGEENLLRVSNIVFKVEDNYDIHKVEAFTMDPTMERSSEHTLIDIFHSAGADVVDLLEEKGAFAVYFDDISFATIIYNTYGRKGVGIVSFFNGTHAVASLCDRSNPKRIP